MDSKINNVDYDQITAKFISDEQLSLTIQQNISFVERYIDVVESSFNEDIEKQIVYRELGSIVYSCIEALLKSVLFEINNRCEKRECKEKKCRYKRYRTLYGINTVHTLDVLRFLLNVRLLGLAPNQIDEITKLNDLRNYVHISKNIGKGDGSYTFSKSYVEDMLFYYYEFLNQLDLADYYFDDSESCLKAIDGDDIELTERQIENDNKTFYLLQAFYAIDKIINNKELSKNDKWVLKTINYKNNVNYDEFLDYIHKGIFYSKRFFNNEIEYEKSKSDFETKIFEYIKGNILRTKIKNKINNIRFSDVVMD